MFGWGANEFGQLGINVISDHINTPTRAATTEPEFFACEVAAGPSYALGYDGKSNKLVVRRKFK
jgi:alpha-tubulin suppressor-like RCC1 family protein